jgi:guanine deaminase
MARTVDLARRYDIPVYSHLCESKGMALQARMELQQYGGSLIRRLHAEGCLGPHMNFAHSVWLAPDEIAILAETGAGTVLNPQGNLKMQCGLPPIKSLMNAGVRIGLGCDNCSCSDAQNMYAAMKLFSLLSAVGDLRKGPPPAVEAMRAATLGAPKARASATSSASWRRATRPISQSWIFLTRASCRSTVFCGNSSISKAAGPSGMSWWMAAG